MAQRKDTKVQLTFEESLQRLEGIVEKLEGGEVPLAESLKLYEEGIKLAKVCAGILTDAELTVKRLGKDLEGALQLFDQDEDERE